MDEGLIDLATQLLVDLLEEEFKDERELILQRCLDNIQMGMSVPVSLRLLRKTLATYPLPSRSWFKSSAAKMPTICSQIEKLQRQYRMLDIVFADLASYHSTLVNQSSHIPSTSEAQTLSVQGRDSSTAQGQGQGQGQTDHNNVKKNDPVQGASSLLSASTLRRNRSADFSMNDRRIQIKGKVGRMSHLKGVIERLDFLQFTLSRSSLTISYAQLQLLWRAFGEEAVTNETLDQLLYWIDSMVTKENKTFTSFLIALAQETDPKDPSSPSKLACLAPRDSVPPISSNAPEGEETSSAFEEGILVKLFEGNILPWVTRREKTDLLNRASLATLCLKLFLLVNVSNKSLKLEADGSWQRVGQLSGMAVLWRMAVCCSDPLVYEAAISLLVEVHHRIPQYKFKNSDVIRGHILRISFRQLSVAMQSLRAGDSDRERERAAQAPDRPESPALEGSAANSDVNKPGVSGVSGLIGDGEYVTSAPVSKERTEGEITSSALSGSLLSPGSGPSDEWFDDGDVLLDPTAIARAVARLIMLLLLYIQRFDQQPTQLITLQILAGRDDSPVLTLTLRSTETVGTLRARVANHFKEPPELISLLKPGRSSQLGNFLGGGQERLEKNELSLRQAKFLPHDSVIARKKDVPVPTGVAGRNPAEKAGPLTEDLIVPKDLSEDLLAVLRPLQWLVSSVGNVDTALTTGCIAPNIVGVQTGTETPKTPSSLLTSTFQLPPFPLPTKSDMTLVPSDSNQDRNLLGMSSLSTPQTHTAAVQGQVQQAGGVVETNLPAPGRLSDCLIPLLKQSPQHMDQLLAMLDGYLSSEIQGAAGVTFDLSAAVWEVLQSLPTHPALLKQVRDMPFERTGGSIRVLLNLASPYRLLYVLQMIDSFLAEVDEKASAAHTVQVSEWALQFLYMGGAEHLVTLTECCIKLLQPARAKEDTLDIPRLIEKRPPPKADVDATVLILGLLYRILHRLLLIDPLYSRWQVASHYGSRDVKDSKGPASEMLYEFPPKTRVPPPKVVGKDSIENKLSKGPPGLVLTCINTPSFVKAAMECVYRHGISGPGSAPLQALAGNALIVVMGLLTVSDDGVQILSQVTSFPAISINASPVLSAARRQESNEGDTLALANTQTNAQSLAITRSASDKVFQDIEMGSSEIPSLKQWVRSLCLTHRDKNVRRAVCLCVFKVLSNIFYLASDPSISSEDKAQKMQLFECIFQAVVCSAHTGYELSRVSDLHASQTAAFRAYHVQSLSTTRTASPSSPVHSPLLQAEQIFSLVASLLALRGVPRLIFPPNPDSELPQETSLTSSPLDSYAKDAEILGELFATQVGFALRCVALCCAVPYCCVLCRTIVWCVFVLLMSELTRRELFTLCGTAVFLFCSIYLKSM